MQINFRGFVPTLWVMAVCGSAVGLMPGSLSAQQGGLQAEKIRQTDAVFAEWDRADSPGCSVGVIQDGSLVFSRGYGGANLDYNVPLDASSVFYIASTSKQFTAAAIARLALDGRISLDDEVQTYIPELPRYDWPVRVRHLVHHTSGLRDYLTLMQLAGQSYEDFWDNASGLALLKRQKALNFEPGSEYLYSNSGYILLAEIVERVTGQSLQEFTREVFFGPLEMSTTQWGEDYAQVVPNRVVSYDTRDDGSYRGWLKNFHGKGDGNLLTSVEDLAQWDQIFYEESGPWGDLLDLALTRGELNDGTELPYAFGLVRSEYRGAETISHGGGMLGFRTEFMRFPGERFSAIVLCNLGSIGAGRLATRVADIWLFESDPPPAESEAPDSEPTSEDADGWAPSANDLVRYEGAYFSDELDVTYALAVEDGVLHMRPTSGDPVALMAFEPDVFGPVPFVRLTFDSGTGPAPGFTLSAGRVREIRFERR